VDVTSAPRLPPCSTFETHARFLFFFMLSSKSPTAPSSSEKPIQGSTPPSDPEAFSRWRDEFPLVKPTSDVPLDHVARAHLEMLVRQTAGMAGLDKDRWPVRARFTIGSGLYIFIRRNGAQCV
jgi:hypothetical protein